jgi:voltage-gated potassium channel
VGTLFYAIGVVADTITAGHVREFRRRRAMQRKIDALKGHFIICAYGRIGRQIARELEREGVPYVVVENNETQLRRLEEEGKVFVSGDAAAQEVLDRAGIQRAKGLLAAVDSDERNVYITLRARTLNPKLLIIARAGQAEAIDLLRHAGADRVVSPYRIGGVRMAELAMHPIVVDVFDAIRHGEAEVTVEELLLSEQSAARDRTIGELRLPSAPGLHILAIRHADGQTIVNPAADVRLRAGDLLIALGPRQQLARIAEQLE